MTTLQIYEEMQRGYPRHAMMGELFLPELRSVPFANLRPMLLPFSFSLAANQTLEASQTVVAPYFIFAINGSSTGSFRVALRDGKSRQPHQVTPVFSGDAVGTGQRPAFLKRPHHLSPQSALNVKVVDTSGAANNVTITVIGALGE